MSYVQMSYGQWSGNCLHMLMPSQALIQQLHSSLVSQEVLLCGCAVSDTVGIKLHNTDTEIYPLLNLEHLMIWNALTEEGVSCLGLPFGAFESC